MTRLLHLGFMGWRKQQEEMKVTTCCAFLINWFFHVVFSHLKVKDGLGMDGNEWAGQASVRSFGLSSFINIITFFKLTVCAPTIMQIANPK